MKKKKRLFRGPSTNDTKKQDGPSRSHTYTRARTHSRERTQVLSMLTEVRKIDSRFHTFSNVYLKQEGSREQEKETTKDQKDETLQPQCENNADLQPLGRSHSKAISKAPTTATAISKAPTTATAHSAAVTVTPYQ